MIKKKSSKPKSKGIEKSSQFRITVKPNFDSTAKDGASELPRRSIRRDSACN